MSLRIQFSAIQTWPGEKTPRLQRKNSPFKATWPRTIELLEAELSHLRAANIVIEADCDMSQIRLDGLFRADAKLNGPCVIVSFDSPKGNFRFPCDRFGHWQANVRAIALSLEALRSVDRYGVTRRAEQYTGWAALPDLTDAESKLKRAAEWLYQQAIKFEFPAGVTASMILRDNVSRAAVYRFLAVRLHPDRSGDDQCFKLLQEHMTAFS